MINIGLTGWGDHQDLYVNKLAGQDKLQLYGAHFPIVEVDSSFYAMQPAKNYVKWVEETPVGFGFIIKAYQGMTGHTRDGSRFDNLDSMFDSFRESIQSVVNAKKLKMVLFQYPPWFDCTKDNVDALRYAKQKMSGVPIALEFRHQSWFTPEMKDRTLTFMEKEGWIHSICDEPQAGAGSIPIVLHPTNSQMTLVRFHGRNISGWNNHGQQNWRDVRYLYQYTEKDLIEWKEKLEFLQKTTKEVCVVFNNNSGGHAAANAKEMIKLLGIEYEGLAPRQLDLLENNTNRT